MKKLSMAVLAALLMIFPVKVAAQEYDTPVVVPEILTVPETVTETTTQEEETPAETKKAKKVKEKKVKEVKEPKVKEPKVKGERKYGFVNHLGIGVGGGVLDGISATAAVPLGGHFALRASYSVGVPDQVYPLEYTVPDLGTVQVSGKDVHMQNIVIRGELTRNLNAMLDIFPSKNGNFHLTVGLSGLLSGDIMSATADLSTPLRDVFGPDEDLSKLFIELADENDSNNKSRISTDKDGILHVTIKDNQASFRPYYGIGWGRVVSIKSFLTMSLDLGVQQVKGIKVVGYNYDGEPQVLNSGQIGHKDKVENIPYLGTQEDILDKLASGELLKGYVPVVRLGLNIRLF